MTSRSYFLGPVTAGDGNAYCGVGCGSENNRITYNYGVFAWDGSGHLRLLCSECGRNYAPELFKLIPKEYVGFEGKPAEKITFEEFAARHYPQYYPQIMKR